MADLLDTANILTVPELAGLLRLSRVYVYKLMREGKIPYYRIGKAARFSRQEVEAWLQERRNVPWQRDKERRPLATIARDSV